MLAFCGQERCLLDSNSRLRLTPHFVEDFTRRCNGEIVMLGLPEGAIALYPEDVYTEIRRRELGSLEIIGSSFAARRSLRRFGALTQPDTITRQGRVTSPAGFREFAGIEINKEVYVVGTEIGVEIWAPDRFDAEMKAIQEHLMKKREQEMLADLENNKI